MKRIFLDDCEFFANSVRECVFNVGIIDMKTLLSTSVISTTLPVRDANEWEETRVKNKSLPID